VSRRRSLRSPFGRRLHSEKRDARARTAFWEMAQSMTPYVAIQHQGDVFIVPTLIDPKLFVKAGRPEFVVLERACAILRKGGRLAGEQTIVDVGAHIGTTTISALRHHGFLQAVAIEPDPVHLPLLRANVALNGLDERVTVVEGGASDTPRQQAFAQGSRKEGTYRWMKGRLVDEPSATTVTVETVTLDGLAEAGIVDPQRAGLLWFDCGRCENAALQSASAFLERRVPIVFTLLRDQFKGSGPLLSRLEETYERVVDLRSPRLSEPLSSWTPSFRPVADLAVLPGEDKKLTDVLVL
jgi:FkbM family methyltransferase